MNRLVEQQITDTTRIVCIRPKGRTQCIFPRSQHSCLYIYIYILTKSEFISSCRRPAVGSNIVQFTCANFFVNAFKKMAASSHFGCPKITLYRISYHFRSIPQFLGIYFTKWLPVVILDVRKSLSIAFLAISDQYKTFIFFIFYKMASGAHFGCPKFTFDRIPGHFRTIRNFILFVNFFLR